MIEAVAPKRITKAEAARRLGVDVKAVGRMIASGDLAVVELPGGVRNIILESSVDALLA